MEETRHSSLGHLPKGDRWAFDESVTDVFTDMLQRSIPQYEIMRRAVVDVGAAFVQPATQIVDLGCSRGDSLAPFVSMFGDANRYVGIEVSKPMLAAARDRFADEIDRGIVRISDMDLRRDYPQGPTSLTLSVLTLQFTPIDHRQRILEDACRYTLPGGALILVEKILGSTCSLDRLLIQNYYNLKAENGFSTEEIERKRLSLEGVLVPVTAKWNEELLRAAGFQEVECFWRWMNFAGWVALRH